MTDLVKVEMAQVTTKAFSANLREDWIKFIRVSEKSRQTYDTCIKQMFKYFSVNGITQPTRENIADWIDGLISKGRSACTVQLYLTSAKLFFRWTSDTGIYPNVADHLKSGVKISSEHKKDALTKEQGANLLKAVKGDSELAKRNRAIIALMLTAGLRTVEVERANVGDLVEVGGSHFLFVQGKGRSEKAERVLIGTQVYNLLINYLSTRKDTRADSPLFTSTSRRNYGKRLSRQSVGKLAKAAMRSIGLDSKRLSAHSLRHSAATAMLLAGIDIADVSMVLRHKSINTTMIYRHDLDRLKNKAEQAAADYFFI